MEDAAGSRWPTHRRALLLWAAAATLVALIFFIVSRSHSSLLDFGVFFDVVSAAVVGLIAFAAVAVPTTLLVALRSSASSTYVISVHVGAIVVMIMAIWWFNG